jgi:DNA-binding transcriptional MerR regulator
VTYFFEEASVRIGQAAARLGISADAIRYYERIGVLPRAPRTPSGYREYSEVSLRRIALVRAALTFGFSVKQVAGFLQSRDRGHPPCHDVRAAGDRLLQAVEARIAQLEGTREDIRRTLRIWDERLAAAEPGAASHLLETLRPEQVSSGSQRGAAVRDYFR